MLGCGDSVEEVKVVVKTTRDDSADVCSVYVEQARYDYWKEWTQRVKVKAEEG